MREKLFPLEPQFRERVWGGQKLKPQTPPIGEVWCAFDDSRVASGSYAGRTVASIASELGAAFVGTDTASRFGPRFPLLIKLLDCADWLSVQVHPNDVQAEKLVGAGQFGKTEAWHFLEADAGATIMAGVKSGTSDDALAAAIRSGKILDVVEKLDVQEGDTLFIRAGTLHALGPGLLLYEVQQSSDTTYRVYDWDRPASAGRALHIEESVAVTDASKGAVLSARPSLAGTAASTLVTCPYFVLDVLQLDAAPLHRRPGGRSFNIVTVTSGKVQLKTVDEAVELGRYETAVVSASADAYELRPIGGPARVLCASVPASES